jgi:hypothetical protein
MPTYNYAVHLFCDACFESHPLGITITLAEEMSNGQSTAQTADSHELPERLLQLRNTSTKCPRTGQWILQRDQRMVFLVRTK